MDPVLDWVVAAGHDLRQLLADALTRLLITQATTASGLESMEITPAADPQSWRWLKTMTIRWGHQVRLVRWNPPDLPGWVVIGAQAGDRKLAGWARPGRSAAARPDHRHQRDLARPQIRRRYARRRRTPPGPGALDRPARRHRRRHPARLRGDQP